jgi:hypothetical protein
LTAVDCPIWFLHKGDQLVTGKTRDIPVTQNFADSEMETALKLDRTHPTLNSTLTFIMSRDDHVSEHSWSPDTRFFAKVSCEWDLKRFPAYRMASSTTATTGAKIWRLKITFHLRQGNAGFDFDYSIGGEFVGRVHSVDFRDLQKEDGR